MRLKTLNPQQLTKESIFLPLLRTKVSIAASFQSYDQK